VALHAAGEAVALGDALHVHVLALGETLDAGRLALLGAREVGHAEFFKVAERLGIYFLRQAELGLVGVLLFLVTEAEADGLVAVLVRGAGVGHAARAGLHYGDRVQVAGGVEDLGHAHLFADQKFMRRGQLRDLLLLLGGRVLFVFFCHKSAPCVVPSDGKRPVLRRVLRGFQKTNEQTAPELFQLRLHFKQFFVSMISPQAEGIKAAPSIGPLPVFRRTRQRNNKNFFSKKPRRDRD
jgi:hypothetical protein